MLPTKRLVRVAVVSWLVMVLAGLALGDPVAADVVLSTLAIGLPSGPHDSCHGFWTNWAADDRRETDTMPEPPCTWHPVRRLTGTLGSLGSRRYRLS
jgi:hypothetical protein